MIVVLLSTICIATKSQNNPQPGQTFRDCKDCPEMVVIPAGSFIMGSPDNEPGRVPEEGPQHKVNIKKFACGKFDITKAQWALFVKQTNKPVNGGCAWSGLSADTSVRPWDLNANANWNHIGFMQDSTHPVVCITWFDAKDYVDWLSKKTGFTYRLLSESEWEYSCPCRNNYCILLGRFCKS